MLWQLEGSMFGLFARPKQSLLHFNKTCMKFMGMPVTKNEWSMTQGNSSANMILIAAGSGKLCGITLKAISTQTANYA